MKTNEGTPEQMAQVIAREEGDATLVSHHQGLYHYAILSTMREGGLSRLQLVFQGGTSLRPVPQVAPLQRGTWTSPAAGTSHWSPSPRWATRSNAGSPQCPRFQRRDPRPQVRGAWSTGGASASVPRCTRRTCPARSSNSGRRHPRIRSVPATVEDQLQAAVWAVRRIPITVESLDEIMADKMLSYVAANHMRYRDLWDMGWIGAKRLSDRSNVWDMLDRKQDDYSEKPDWASRLSGDRDIPAALRSRGFHDELARFIEPTALESTIDDEVWRHATASESACSTTTGTSRICRIIWTSHPASHKGGTDPMKDGSTCLVRSIASMSKQAEAVGWRRRSVASWNAGEESAYGGASAAGEVGGEAVTGSITPGTAASTPSARHHAREGIPSGRGP